MLKNQYKGRGIHDEKMYNSLLNGNLRKMLNMIVESGDLDVQIRNNYLNIYYRGGNIAKVNSERSIEFDEKYFCLPGINTDGKEEKRNLIEKFKTYNYKAYFETAKQVMNKWFKEHPNPERDEQHLLAVENKYTQSDYAIIDIEYQVSIQSEFNCTFIPQNKSNPKKPRFDIIAVNKQGQVAVIELKKGVSALKNTSGLQEHLDCYNASIGRTYVSFMEEIQKILEQKQQLGLVDNTVKITKPAPVFMFAYAYNDSISDEEQMQKFIKIYNNIKSDSPVPVIWLERGSHKLLDR
jgi:hypothetical protein